ncbi:unnamed protein product [Brachionus calyciflorus]|uniref:PID domain-containing protein n=1 Tax=Brachionus calyciflorus TaxID=104777 RepID=A0A813Z3N6_9BILA|nr:unnamed protein product [Brachionus calyciflorus]
MSSLNNEDQKYTVKAMYLGSEPMGELLEGESGSDVIQVPLKRTILRTNSIGKEVDLSITSDSLIVNFIKQERNSTLKLPVELLAYCGALRQLPPNQFVSREFETLDKSPPMLPGSFQSPPLFVTIFRCLENENTLYCHSFVIRKDEEAMELVKLVMEIYYNCARMNQSIDSADEDDFFNNSQESTDLNFNDIKRKKEFKINDNINKDKLDELLKMYNSQSIDDSKEKSVVSAKDIIKEALNSSEYKLEKFGDVPLNEDENPIVIKKENKDEIVYKQNVFIRWLQPPTPPPPAPIIIREVQDPTPETLPPLVICKQAPRPPTPPPLIIRERPPTPIEVPKEPLIIERRVPVPEKHRKVIIEHLPPPPPKPRDIILEKWLPREPAPRSVYVQKSNQISHQKPIYEVFEKNKISSPKTPQRSRKDQIENSKEITKTKSVNRRSDSNEPVYQSHPVYTSKSSKQQKIAGYRIIRQIIPGPSSTPSDIERALARSQKVSCTVYSNHQQMYSPCYENVKHRNYCSPARHYQAQTHQCGNKFVANVGPNIYTPGSGCYSVVNYNPHSKARQVVMQQNYSPHNNLFNKIDPNNGYVRKDFYRSSSFDRF